MKRLGLSVEGQTELEFVNRVLKPHLLLHGWQVVKPVSLDGGVSIRSIRREIELMKNNFSHLSTMYDLYAFPDAERQDAPELTRLLASHFSHLPTMLPYVQRHEFEALLFAAPEIVAQRFPEVKSGLQEMRRVLQECGSAENINHGYESCPSRRLKRIFPKYNKLLHGPVLVAEIGLPVLRQTCPHFGAWLTTLEAWGQN